MENKFIFKSNGFYLGFIRNDYLFSRDGLYLGWIEGEYVWDKSGQFRGILAQRGAYWYIIVKRFTMQPIPRTPKVYPVPTVPPAPPANIAPIDLPVEVIDAFK